MNADPKPQPTPRPQPTGPWWPCTHPANDHQQALLRRARQLRTGALQAMRDGDNILAVTLDREARVYYTAARDALTPARAA